MRVVAILQARTGSTRLPNKVLLPLASKSMLQNIIERVQRADTIDAVVVTYPLGDGEAFVPILDACRQRNAEGYATKQVFGSQWWEDPSDLVGRYLQAAITHNAEIVVRIPCDNPCVDPAYIDEAVQEYRALPRVYVSTMFPCVEGHVYLDGVGAEVLSLSRLKWLDQITLGKPAYREHPHLLFQDQHLIAGWEQYQRHANHRETIRLDVNTQSEYEFIADIYTHFGHNRFTTADILTYLATKEAPHAERQSTPV